MYCNDCGASLGPQDRHCTACGRAVPLQGNAAAAGLGRVERHHLILGGLWIARAIMVLAVALFVLAVVGESFGGMEFHRGLPGFGGHPEVIATMLHGIGWGLVALAVLMAIAGIGLLRLQSWARMLAIVLGILDLVSVPLGTALGIYTLWVLAPRASDAEYAALAHAKS